MSVERVEGHEPGPREHPYGDFNIIASDYFRALGVPLVRGRDFNAADIANGPAVVIVNEAFARRYWPGQEAVGKRSSSTDRTAALRQNHRRCWATHNRRLIDSPRPAFYFHARESRPVMTLAVRTGLEPGGALACCAKW
jgi:hypothetical protein